MNYYINRIYLKNFKCINNKNGVLVDFSIDKGLIALGGPNGFGKTTIYDAIQIAFCDKIDRIFSVYKRNKKFKDHLLIYKNRTMATIAIELIDNENNDIVTLIKRINKDDSNYENNLQESIESFWTNEKINVELINNINYGYKIVNLSYFLKEKLGLDNEYFNLFYYISQDNNADYLKKSTVDRQPLFEVLMKIENEINMEEKIKGLLNYRKNISVEKDIESRINEIKEKIKELNNFSDDSKYQPNVKIFPNTNDIEWDRDDYLVKNKKIIDEINKICLFVSNYNSFLSKTNNIRIRKLLIEESLSEFIKVISTSDYDASIEYDKNIYNKIDSLKSKKSLYESILQVEKFSFEDENIMSKLSTINNQLDIDIDVEEISTDIRNVIAENNKLGLEKKKIKNLKESIEKLNSLFIDTVSKPKQNICPVCKTPFGSSEKLQEIINDNINELEKLILSNNKDKEKNVKDKLLSIVAESKKLLSIVDINQEIKIINSTISFLRKYIKNQNIIDYVQFFDSIGELENVINLINHKNINSINSIESILQSKILNEGKDYSDEKYNNDKAIYMEYFVKYEQQGMLEDNINILFENLKKKKRYFIRELSLRDSEKKLVINNKIKELIKLEEVKKELSKLKRVYSNTITEYKKKVVSEIEIPLYIYTGKIIQTYQGGLGIFIKPDKNNSDNIIFTPNIKESEHDIVNTFSSGQLAGFTIAFLLVVNQLYKIRNADGNTLNTILIDDPVQTMDDVNIASLCEILRNQFYKYQIILSTHEDEKINFMRYKFEKFGIKTMEYNVKEHFFNN